MYYNDDLYYCLNEDYYNSHSIDEKQELKETTLDLKAQNDKLKAINDLKEEEIKKKSQRNIRIEEFERMSKEELEAMVQTEREMNNRLMKMEKLKKEKRNKEKELKHRQQYLNMEMKDIRNRDFYKKYKEYRAKYNEFREMRAELDTLKVEKDVWELISDNMDPDFKTAIIEQRETREARDKEIRVMRDQVRSKLDMTVRQFNEMTLYIDRQFAIHENNREAIVFRKELAAEKMEMERFEFNRNEEARLHPRPNARKDDLFYGFQIPC